MDDRQKRVLIARRIAQELADGDVVNLGIGLPTLVGGFIPMGSCYTAIGKWLWGSGPIPLQVKRMMTWSMQEGSP